MLISLLVSTPINSQNLTISNTLNYAVEFPNTNWTLEKTSDTGNVLYDKAKRIRVENSMCL